LTHANTAKNKARDNGIRARSKEGLLAFTYNVRHSGTISVVGVMVVGYQLAVGRLLVVVCGLLLAGRCFCLLFRVCSTLGRLGQVSLPPALEPHTSDWIFGEAWPGDAVLSPGASYRSALQDLQAGV
jgi:hypothetical protein